MSNLPTEEGYKLRPRDISKIIEILDSRDDAGNKRYLDQRDIITRALEHFYTWELDPEKFLDEIKNDLILPQKIFLLKWLKQEYYDKMEIEPEKFLEEIEEGKERFLTGEARKSKKDYDRMLTNLESAKNVIKQINMKDLKSNVAID